MVSDMLKYDTRYPTGLRNMGKKYINAFVTFIDILGFKNLVANNDPKNIIDILDVMQLSTNIPQVRPVVSPKSENLPMVIQFSDSVLRIQPIDENDSTISVETFFQEEINSLILAQGHLVSNGILVRGGLTFGEICVSDHRLFGPAFTKAYLMESSLANYPRIIIDECLLSAAHNNPLSSYFENDFDVFLTQIFDYLIMSEDGQYSINYLQHLYSAHKYLKSNDCDPITLHHDQLFELFKKVLELKDIKLLSKIRWVMNYHNKIVKRVFKGDDDNKMGKFFYIIPGC